MKFLQILVLILGLVLCANSQPKDKSILSGTVYDADGSVVVQAIVNAVNEKGEKFETLTNQEGVYSLTLPFNRYDRTPYFTEAKYDIVVEVNGFKKSITKSFIFVPSQFGKMQLDIGLEIGRIIDTIHVPSTKTKKKPKSKIIKKRKN